MRNYPRRSTIQDEELGENVDMNPEASAFMSNFTNPRVVPGPSHRLSESEDPRRFVQQPAVAAPQITGEQLRFLQKINSCYYINNQDQLRDRHTGKMVKF